MSATGISVTQDEIKRVTVDLGLGEEVGDRIFEALVLKHRQEGQPQPKADPSSAA